MNLAAVRNAVRASVRPSINRAWDAAVSVDTDAQAFIDAASITDETQKLAIIDLVAAWKAAGQWERTVAIYPFVGGSASAHKFNLKDPRDLDAAHRLVFSGTFTHSATGIDPDGTTGVANTFIDPNLDLPQYSFSFGYYSRDNSTPSGDALLMGSNNMWVDVYPTNRIDVSLEQSNYATGATLSTTANSVTNFDRLIGFSQNGPSSVSIYRSKSRLVHNTTEIYNYWAQNRSLRLFGSINAPAWAGRTSRECGLAFFSRGMDLTTWGLISDAIDAFQTTLGRNV